METEIPVLNQEEIKSGISAIKDIKNILTLPADIEKLRKIFEILIIDSVYYSGIVAVLPETYAWKYSPGKNKWEKDDYSVCSEDKSVLFYADNRNNAVFLGRDCGEYDSDFGPLKISGLESFRNLIRLRAQNPNEIDSEAKSTSLSSIIEEIYIPVELRAGKWVSGCLIPSGGGWNYNRKSAKKVIDSCGVFNTDGLSAATRSGWLPFIKWLTRCKSSTIKYGKEYAGTCYRRIMFEELDEKLIEKTTTIFEESSREFVFCSGNIFGGYGSTFKALSRGVGLQTLPSLSEQDIQDFDTLASNSIDPVPQLETPLFLVNPCFSADYVAMWANVKNNGGLLLSAIRCLLDEKNRDILKGIKVPFPCKSAQIKEWAQIEYAKNGLKRLMRDIDTTITDDIPLQSRKLTISYAHLEKSVAGVQEEFAKSEVFLRPLPYSLEKYISAYQAGNIEKITRAATLFEQIHKQVILLAIEEFLSLYGPEKMMDCFGKELRDKLLGRPALGDWYLALSKLKAADAFQMAFSGELLGALWQHRKEQERLIGLRNSIKHPGAAYEDSEFEKAADAFSNYFNRVLTSLRQAYNGKQMLRFSSCGQAKDGLMQISGLAIDRGAPPFKTQTCHIPLDKCDNLSAGNILCFAGSDSGEFFPLKFFFLWREAAVSISGDLFVYNKEFIGSKETQWTGILSGNIGIPPTAPPF